MRDVIRAGRSRPSGFAMLYVVCSALPAAEIGTNVARNLVSAPLLPYVLMAIGSMAVAAGLERWLGRRRKLPPFVAVIVAIAAGITAGIAAVWFETIAWLIIACAGFRQCP